MSLKYLSKVKSYPNGLVNRRFKDHYKVRPEFSKDQLIFVYSNLHIEFRPESIAFRDVLKIDWPFAQKIFKPELRMMAILIFEQPDGTFSAHLPTDNVLVQLGITGIEEITPGLINTLIMKDRLSKT